MDFDRPPSWPVLLLIGAGVLLLMCLSCACTAPFFAMFWNPTRRR